MDYKLSKDEKVSVVLTYARSRTSNSPANDKIIQNHQECAQITGLLKEFSIDSEKWNVFSVA
jgi:hypothetical protein